MAFIFITFSSRCELMNFSQLSAHSKSISDIDDKSKLLSLRNVSYKIGPQRLLSHIDIDIAVNETVSLVGPNGAGKSTLVKLILGLIDPTDGTITAHQSLQLGYVPQRFAIPPILPLRVSDLLGQANKKRLTKEQRQFIFDHLSLTHLLSRQMLHLSDQQD